MPLSSGEALRNIQIKIINDEELNTLELMMAGRDYPVKEIYGYKLKSDYCYRAISNELFEICQKKDIF